MREKQIVIGDHLISYLTNDTSDPAARTVVFLHGWRSESRVWAEVISRLLEQGEYNVFALDLPGFGKSPAPKTPFTLLDYRNIVNGFVEKLSIGKVCLVGHSFGGRIAIKVAAMEQGPAHCVVLVNSPGFRMHRKRNAVLQMFAKLVKPIFRIPALGPLRVWIYRLLGAEDYVSTPELRETFLHAINEDLTAQLPLIKQDTLIIWGARDRVTPLFLATWLKEHIHNSRLKVLNQAGHYSFLDDPDGFSETLHNFLNA